MHARDDHDVPVDFAIAAARRHLRWTLRLLQEGGHHAYVRAAAPWAEIVVPRLTYRRRKPRSGAGSSGLAGRPGGGSSRL